MAGAEERKTRNEKKDASPPRGRKKLDFRTPSPANNKPLKGKNIYLDLKNYRQQRSVESDLKFLGANVVTFFSKDIKFVITNQGQPRDYKDEAEGSSGVPSPAVSTPSPFNLGHGQNVNSPQNGSPGAVEGQKVALTIRGKTIASRAKTFSARGSNDVLQNAKTFGAKIIHVDTVLGYIVKEKEKLPKEQKNVGKPSAAKGKLPERLLKSKKLKNPFIKFESTNKHYRPVYKQLDAWPKLDANTPSGTCPFDGTTFRGGARAERAEREEGEERDCSEDRSSGRDKPKRDSSKPRGRTDSADFMESGHILTAGEMRRKNDAKRKAEQKRGFCELCCVKYDDIVKHARVEEHQKFARNDKNYENLDELITGNGPTLELFIKDVITTNAEQREKQKQMRSKPVIEKTSSPRSKPSSKLSKSPQGQSGSKSSKSPSIRKKGARESPRLLSRKRNSPCRSAVVDAEVTASSDPAERNNLAQIQASTSLLVSEARKSSAVVEDFESSMSLILKESQSFDLTKTEVEVQGSLEDGATLDDCEVEVNNNVIEFAEKSRRDSRKRTRSAQKQFNVEKDVPQNSSKVEISKTETPEVIRRICAETTEETDTEMQSSGVDSNVLKSPAAPVRALSSITRTRAESGGILSPRRSWRGSGSPPTVESTSSRNRKISGVRSSSESTGTSQECTVSSEASGQETETCENVPVEPSPVKDVPVHVSPMENTNAGTRYKAKMLPENCLPSQTVADPLQKEENLKISPGSIQGVQHEVVDDVEQTYIGIVTPRRRSTRIVKVTGELPGRIILDTPPRKEIDAVTGDCDGMMEISSPQKSHGPRTKLCIHDEHSPAPYSKVNSSLVSSLLCSGAPSGQVLNSPGRPLRSHGQLLPFPLPVCSPTSSSYSPGAVRDSTILLSPHQLPVNTPRSLKNPKQNSDDSIGLNVLLYSSPHRSKKGPSLAENGVAPLGSSPVQENSAVLFGHKMFIRGERISSPGRVVLDRHRTDHHAISENVMMSYEAVVEKVKNHDIDALLSPSPPPRKRSSRGKLEFKSNASVSNTETDFDTDTGLGKAFGTDTKVAGVYDTYTDFGQAENNTDTEFGKAENTNADIGSMGTNNTIGVEPDSVSMKTDLDKQTNKAQDDVNGSGALENKSKKTGPRRKSQVTGDQKDSHELPQPQRTASNSVESTDMTAASSKLRCIVPELILERVQVNESTVVRHTRGKKSWSRLTEDEAMKIYLGIPQESGIAETRNVGPVATIGNGPETRNAGPVATIDNGPESRNAGPVATIDNGPETGLIDEKTPRKGRKSRSRLRDQADGDVNTCSRTRSCSVTSTDTEKGKENAEAKDGKAQKLCPPVADNAKTGYKNRAESADSCLSVADSGSVVHETTDDNTDTVDVESPLRRTLIKGRKSQSCLRSEDNEVGHLDQKQETLVVKQSRKRRKSQSLPTAAVDLVSESSLKSNTRSHDTEDKVLSVVPVSSPRLRTTRSSSVDTTGEDSGRSKVADSSVPRKHNLDKDIECVAVALRSVLKKCASSESKESNRDVENKVPTSEKLAVGATADEQFAISETDLPVVESTHVAKPENKVTYTDSCEKHEENSVQNVEHVSSFAEEFGLVPLRITRKFFKDVSSGAFENKSRSPVSSQIDATPQSKEGKSRTHIKSSSNNASADFKVSGMEGSESCEGVSAISEQPPIAVEPVPGDVKSTTSKISSQKKRRKLNRKAPGEKINDRQSSRSSRRQQLSAHTNSIGHIRSGLLSPEPTMQVAKTGEAPQNGKVTRSKIGDRTCDQDFSSESEIGFVGGFDLGSESDASSTWDQTCDSYVARLCETPYGKICGNSSAAETSQDEGDTLKQNAAEDMEVSSHRRSARITPRKVADLKEKDSPHSRVSSPNKHINSAVARSIKLLNSPKSSKTKTSEPFEPVVDKDAVVGESSSSLKKRLRNTQHHDDEECVSALSSSQESEYPVSEDGTRIRCTRKRKWKESDKMTAGKTKRKNRIRLNRSRYRAGSNRTEPNDFVSDSESVKSEQDNVYLQDLSSADRDLETESDVGDKERKVQRKSRSRSRVGADSNETVTGKNKRIGLNSGMASSESCGDDATATFLNPEDSDAGNKHRKSSARGKTGSFSDLENASGTVQHDFEVNCSISPYGSVEVEHRILQISHTESGVFGDARKSGHRTRSRVGVDEASDITKNPLQTEKDDVNSPRCLRVNRALMSLKNAVDSTTLLNSNDLGDAVEPAGGNGVSQSSTEACPVTPTGERYTIAELVHNTPRSCRKDAVDMARELLKATTPRKRSVNKVILEVIRVSSPTADLEARLENEKCVSKKDGDECSVEWASPTRRATPGNYGQQRVFTTPKQDASTANSHVGESDMHLSKFAGNISLPVGSKLRLKRKRHLSSDGLKNSPSGKLDSEFSSFAVEQVMKTPEQGRKFSLPDVGMSPGLGRDEVDRLLKSDQKKTVVAVSEKDLEDSVLVIHMNSPPESSLNNSKAEEEATKKNYFGSRKSDPLTSPVLKTCKTGTPHSKGKDKGSKGYTLGKHTEIFLPFDSLKHITSKATSGEKPKSPKKKLLKKLSDRPKSYRLGMDRLFTTKSLGPNRVKVACGCSNNHGAKGCKIQVKNSLSGVKHGKITKHKNTNKVAWSFGQNPNGRNSPQRAAALAASKAISSPQKTIYGSIKRKQPTSPSPKSSAHSAARKKLELAKSCKTNSPSMTSRLYRGTVASSAKVRQKLNMSPAKRKQVGGQVNKPIVANVSVLSDRKVSLRERNTQIRYDYSDEDGEDQDPYCLV